MNFLAQFWISAIQIVSICIGALSGFGAVVFKTKQDDGQLTRWGEWARALVIVSALISVLLEVGKAYQSAQSSAEQKENISTLLDDNKVLLLQSQRAKRVQSKLTIRLLNELERTRTPLTDLTISLYYRVSDTSSSSTFRSFPPSNQKEVTTHYRILPASWLRMKHGLRVALQGKDRKGVIDYINIESPPQGTLHVGIHDPGIGDDYSGLFYLEQASELEGGSSYPYLTISIAGIPLDTFGRDISVQSWEDLFGRPASLEGINLKGLDYIVVNTEQGFTLRHLFDGSKRNNPKSFTFGKSDLQ